MGLLESKQARIKREEREQQRRLENARREAAIRAERERKARLQRERRERQRREEIKRMELRAKQEQERQKRWREEQKRREEEKLAKFRAEHLTMKKREESERINQERAHYDRLWKNGSNMTSPDGEYIELVGGKHLFVHMQEILYKYFDKTLAHEICSFLEDLLLVKRGKNGNPSWQSKGLLKVDAFCTGSKREEQTNESWQVAFQLNEIVQLPASNKYQFRGLRKPTGRIVDQNYRSATVFIEDISTTLVFNKYELKKQDTYTTNYYNGLRIAGTSNWILLDREIEYLSQDEFETKDRERQKRLRKEAERKRKQRKKRARIARKKLEQREREEERQRKEEPERKRLRKLLKQKSKGVRQERHYGWFRCYSCRKIWESAYCTVVNGVVIYSQDCKSCNTTNYPYKHEQVMCSSCQQRPCICDRRDGDENKPHRSDLCEACKNGVCPFKKYQTTSYHSYQADDYCHY